MRDAVTGLADSEGQAGRYRPYAYPGQIANFLGFETPRVPFGTPSHPIITTPATVHTPAKGAPAAESTVVVAADALTPTRVTGSLRYAVEDVAVSPRCPSFCAGICGKRWAPRLTPAF